MRAALRACFIGTLVVALAGLVAGVSLPARAHHGTAEFQLERVASGLQSPDYVAQAPGDPRLFVVERAGRIRIVRAGVVAAKPFLDLHELVGSNGEQGLYSVAFHPNFAQNGRLFIDYASVDGADEVWELHAARGASTVDGVPRLILSIPHPRATHNGGQLQFGRDGYLYISTGDGGGVGDPDRNAQRRSSLLGKILRININRRSDDEGYSIPYDNPFTGVVPWLSEIYALGLRNPWRFSFDRLTGDLWLGDVGQDRFEEVDHVERSQIAGSNFGWSRLEGTEPFAALSLHGGHYVRPAGTYPHSLGCSVIGGYVYRGPKIESLSGQYVFSDFCSARIWTMAATGGPIVEVGSGLGSGASEITSFGEGSDGTLYVTSARGGVYRFDPAS